MKDLDSTIHTVRDDTVRDDTVRDDRSAAFAEASASSTESSSSGSYWRSLEQLAETADFEQMLQREFPLHATRVGNVDRRRFLQLSGASLGLAGLTACTKQPPEKIIPYVQQPEDIIPGKPLFYATSISDRGYAAPVLAESHMGRPTKLEGNPEHPASQGGTSAAIQAQVLSLYDPDRSQAITHLGQIRSWQSFVEQVTGLRSALTPLAGAGLAILTGRVTSPTTIRLLDQLLAEMPGARHYVDESAAGNAEAGLRQATGTAGSLTYDFTAADVVVAIDSDFLDCGPGAVRYSKDFRQRRMAHTLDDARSMSRLYVVESMPCSTSTVADHRLSLKPSHVVRFALALAAELGVAGASAPTGGDERFTAWVQEVAADLRASAGRSAVVIGDYMDAEVHALGLAINSALGNIGSTVKINQAFTAEGASLDDLIRDIDTGSISTLLVAGGNPVYSSGVGTDVAAAMDKVTVRIHLGAHIDETGERCHWHIPESHSLESWGDLRSLDGTASITQPLITPLYDSHSLIDVLGAFLGRTESALDLVRETWSGQLGGGDFEKSWRRVLHDGYVPGTEAVAQVASISGAAAASALAGMQESPTELIFRPDPTIFDGRYANNGWLQECPKPITKLTWDNALMMSPATAYALELGDLLPGNEQRDRAPMVKLTAGERSLLVPVWVVPGLADDTYVLHTGYGRRGGGNIALGAGFDVNQLRVSGEWRSSGALSVEDTGETYLLACTQDHHSMEGRAPIKATNVPTYEAYPEQPVERHLHVDPRATLMPGDDFVYNSYQWGMSIDLTACTGCNACLVACVSENNIPVIGKEEVRRGREMHWIRVDRYFSGNDPNDVEQIVNQPVPCMQCEQAPCEVVCPVAATVHSDEGLNDMVYNRCVGTRYCSNNCPYKVRRFNFLLYQDFETPQLKLGRNPDVTVRSRGVMEKCTYCVQRINSARIESRREARTIRDGEVTTACQQACPSDAIVFGDQGDASTQVAQVKTSGLEYALLEELGTRPRTTYLARVANPNPALWQRLYPDRPLVAERHHGAGHGDGHDAGHGDDHIGGDAHGEAEGHHGIPEDDEKAHGSHAPGQPGADADVEASTEHDGDSH